MRGHIRSRNGRYYLYYDAPPVWEASSGRWKRSQKCERVPDPNTKKHAERILASRIAEIDQGEFREVQKIRFRDFVGLWMQNYAQGQVRPSTLDRYQSLFAVHLLPAFGDCLVHQISVESVQQFRAEKQATGQSPQSVKHMLRLLRQMLNHAADWGYLRHNPASKVKDPRVPRREMDFLTPAEVRLLLEHIPDAWYSLILTAVTTGLRLGELLAMKWGNLDWAAARYHVRETVVRGSRTRPVGFGPVKTDCSLQSVDLTPRLLETLRQHQSYQAEVRLMATSYSELNLIFATAKGLTLDDRNVAQRVLEPSLKAAGLRRIRFHDLRHTCASLLIAQGENVKYVQRQLRHASAQITFDRYGHLLPEARQEAVRRLDGVLFGESSMRSPGHATSTL